MLKQQDDESRAFNVLNAIEQSQRSAMRVNSFAGWTETYCQCASFRADLVHFADTLNVDLTPFMRWLGVLEGELDGPQRNERPDFGKVVDAYPAAEATLHKMRNRIGEGGLGKLPDAPSKWAADGKRDQHTGKEQHDFDCNLVTLDEAAAIVNRSKRTLERQLSKMPSPHIQGMGGKASYWKWGDLRPFLEREYRPDLPVKFPGNIR